MRTISRFIIGWCSAITCAVLTYYFVMPFLGSESMPWLLLVAATAAITLAHIALKPPKSEVRLEAILTALLGGFLSGLLAAGIIFSLHAAAIMLMPKWHFGP